MEPEGVGSDMGMADRDPHLCPERFQSCMAVPVRFNGFTILNSPEFLF
jgi:hypothetical protein